jgi:predicted aldo/keto reductase-like oxidoreductase
MPARREEITLATKIGARKADDARRQIELSLKRLLTDHLDVLHIHALAGPEDLAAIEAPDGVLKALYEAREQKVARAIGITCHAAPAALQTALERHDFDCTQMALNAALARMAEARAG